MMVGQVYVFAHVQSKPRHEGDLRAAQLRPVTKTQSDPGFVRYELCEGSENPDHCAFYEAWHDQALLDLYGATPQIAAHGELTKQRLASATVKIFRKIN